jgi:hypothetical protein
VSGVSLARELAQAVEALSDTQHEELVQAGVDRLDIALGLVGAAYGHVTASNRFDPHPDGRLAFVTPIRCHDPRTLESPVPASAVRVGEIIDLVYWHPAAPRRWALRTGVADCLGLIPPQYCGPEPVAIHRGVVGWFRAGCDGLVILSCDPWRVYGILTQCVSGILAEDPRHAEELRAAIDHPWPHPEVFVREARHAITR